MKLQFEKQQYQDDAVSSVVDLFKGQESVVGGFDLCKEDEQMTLETELGFGNKLNITDETLIKNMQEIQRRNGQPETEELEKNNFCIEMETGTGKTFVYTKTIFELNEKYGFTKFIIVVPSVAIREGVHKSLKITEDYLKNQYGNKPFNYFVYDSSDISRIRQFTTSNNIEVMIINIQAFINDDKIIKRPMDKLNGNKPIRYIQDTNPVVIIDEPQSVDSTDKAKKAINSLNPLTTLRYSATHKDKLNTLYKLTPVDAYNNGLVKQISVFSDYVNFDYNRPYIKLLEVDNSKGFKAKIELDIIDKKGSVSRKVKTIKPKDDLFLISGERELYEGFVVSAIDCSEGSESIEFANTQRIELGKAIGDVQEEIIKRSQIKSTIEIHLDKELRLLDKGIKVLSLFFIDKVERYRDYDSEDLKGEYAKIFEECYEELIQKEKYEPIRNKFKSDISKIHNGYFSKDKKGVLKNTKGNTSADDDTYNTIMKDKEWLLSFDCPLRFIWSHSALREGWDNPNVFQICTLIDQKSMFTIRQKIGRGLRLCVNQEGKRIKDKSINRLHVMANESFTDFVSKLQKEMEQETGIKFGTIQQSIFNGQVYTDTVVQLETITETRALEIEKVLVEKDYIVDNKPSTKLIDEIANNTFILPKELEEVKEKIVEQVLDKKEQFSTQSLVNTKVVVEKVIEKTITPEESKEIFVHLKEKNYIDNSGRITKDLEEDIKNNTFEVPKRFEKASETITKVIVKSTKNVPPVDDERNKVIVKLKKEKFIDPKFTELWDKIKQKTTYRVSIDDNELKKNILKELKEMDEIPEVIIERRIADVNQDNIGIGVTDVSFKVDKIQRERPKLPNILKILLEDCDLPTTLSRDILVESGRLDEFARNPQMFIEKLKERIKIAKNKLYIEGIKYVKLNGQEYYLQEVFDSEEIAGYLNKNALQVENSIYDHVIYDSETIEKTFAQKLDEDDEVKFFFKIPSKFQIKTPVGNYNPDWAVYMNKDGTDKMYFVIETKGSTILEDLRSNEMQKIKFGKKHFEAIGEELHYKVATDWHECKRKI